MNKKGASTDNFYLMVGIFASGIIILILSVLWTNVSGVDYLWSQADVGSKIHNDVQGFVDRWDFIMLGLYVGSHLSVLALSFLLRTYPLMYIAGMFFTVLLLIIAPTLSNEYGTLLTNSAFVNVANNFPMLNYIMAHLPLLELIWSVLTLIVLYGFAKSEGVV